MSISLLKVTRLWLRLRCSKPRSTHHPTPSARNEAFPDHATMTLKPYLQRGHSSMHSLRMAVGLASHLQTRQNEG